MNFSEIKKRVENGEVAMVESITDEGANRLPEDYIRRYPHLFREWVLEDDIEKANIIWIYDSGKVYGAAS